MSRYIPAERQPIDVAGSKPVDVRAVIAYANNCDARLNGDGAGIRASVRIDAAIGKSEGKPFVELDEDAWKLVCQALDKPSPLPGWAPYPVTPARSLQPFIQDVLDAKDALPEVKEPEAQKAAE